MKQKILVGIIIVGYIFLFFPEYSFALEENLEEEVVTLEKCVDGDTATFQDSLGSIFKTRFLAIDTPETVHPTKKVEQYGKEASEYTCNRLTNAKEIKLEYDEGSDKEDKYGRRLAWIFVDGELLQEELIELGYAKVAYLYGDYRYTELLQEKEQQSKEKKVGIWLEEKEEEQEEEKIETVEQEKKEKKKNWIEKLIDYTLGEIFRYIDKILEKIAKYVESVL